MNETENQHPEPVVMPPAKSKAQFLERFQVRFQPGQSGNPGGRPKTRILSAAAREKLNEVNPDTGLTYAQEVVNALVKEAKKGNVFAARELKEWVEGKISVAVTAELSDADATSHTVKSKLFQKLIGYSAIEEGSTAQ
jgi:Family of unknown function (DUF5681)